MELIAALPIAMSNQHMPVCRGRWPCREPGSISEKSSKNHLCPAAGETSFAFSQDSYFCSQPAGSLDLPSVGMDNTAIHFYAIFWAAPRFHRNTAFGTPLHGRIRPSGKGQLQRVLVPVTQCNRLSNVANVLLPGACLGIFFEQLCTFS